MFFSIEAREQRPGTLSEGSADLRGTTFWIVPHTHWDREWYQPLETFRLRMSRVFDEVLDVLEADPRMCFTLDGQAVLLEDYDEQRPQHRARLEALIRDGRIAIGPSYVLADEFLIGAESHVRNLLAGARVCRRWGGRPMRVGYVPDTFGHIAQLPQLLRGFGIGNFVFQRGLGDEAHDVGAAFTWRGPDGSEVLAVAIVDGYTSAYELGHWSWRTDGRSVDPGRGDHGPGHPELAAQRLRELVELHHARIETAGLRDLLACNGFDHLRIQRDLPDIVEATRDHLPDSELRIATYEEYVEHLEKTYEPRTRLEGELLGGLEHQVTRSVNSTRMYLKQANARAESELYAAEVLASLAWLRHRLHPSTAAAYTYPQGDLELAWRELLRTHPHDSICGCSIDEVHRDMLQRFTSARQYADAVGREALEALAGRAIDWNWGMPTDPPAEPVALNVLPWRRRDVVELGVPVALADAPSLVARSPTGTLPVQRIDGGRALVAVDVDGFAGTPLTLEPGTDATVDAPACALDERTLDNGVLRVEVANDGTLTLVDHARGIRLERVHEFEDCADRGDEYNFDALSGETPWRGPGRVEYLRVVEDGPVRATLEVRLVLDLPERLSDDRTTRIGSVACGVTMFVRLHAGADRVELETTIDNRASDHRLRVLVPATHHEEVRSEGHFLVLRRPDEVSEHPNWVEQRCRTHHHAGMVVAGDAVVTAPGLPEYEMVPATDGAGWAIAQTLLRCVGWLSRDDLASRPYGAGPSIPTPDAQCPGTHRFRYAISLRGSEPDVRLVRDAQELRQPLVAAPPGADPTGLLAIDGDDHTITALKLAEDGAGLVARVYAPGGAPARAEIRTSVGDVSRCRLDETGATALPDGVLELRACEIGTVRIA